jgi:glycogen debranching enzyme
MEPPASYADHPDATLIWEHCRVSCEKPGFLCEPKGVLRHPYICPGGFYSQLWCWDALFAGIGALPFGGGRYLLGSMLNFLEHTDLSTGAVPGCLTPTGPSSTLAHAKPVIIQGALLGARACGDLQCLRAHLPAMRALLGFWERERRDAASGLYTWYDQMESGADDLPYAEVPSKHTASWSAERHACAFSAPDLAVFLHREHSAFACLLEAWAGAAGGEEAGSASALAQEAGQHRAQAASLAQQAAAALWVPGSAATASGGSGYWGAFNTRSQALIPARTYQMAFPLWVPGMGTPQQRAQALASVLQPDMRGACGVRSTSSSHPSYELKDAIVPYSIWRGPVWLNVNMVLCYSLAQCGQAAEAERLAQVLVRVLAADLRASGAWHECYHPDTGAPLSSESKGFLSWTVMAAGLLDNLAKGVDPTAI